MAQGGKTHERLAEEERTSDQLPISNPEFQFVSGAKVVFYPLQSIVTFYKCDYGESGNVVSSGWLSKPGSGCNYELSRYGFSQFLDLLPKVLEIAKQTKVTQEEKSKVIFSEFLPVSSYLQSTTRMFLECSTFRMKTYIWIKRQYFKNGDWIYNKNSIPISTFENTGAIVYWWNSIKDKPIQRVDSQKRVLDSDDEGCPCSLRKEAKKESELHSVDRHPDQKPTPLGCTKDSALERRFPYDDSKDDVAVNVNSVVTSGEHNPWSGGDNGRYVQKPPKVPAKIHNYL